MTFPRSPRLLKGAIVAADIGNPLPQVIVFQYNPASLTRSLEPQMAANDGERGEALRIKGAPVETISLEVEIDATDQLEQAKPIAVSQGIYPQLSALEMLLYPKSALVIANTVLSALGTIEIVPPVGPLTMFIWGPKRVLPVKLTSFSVTEEAFDVNLNPIMAKVSLGLRVLSYNDLPVTHPGYHLFMAHQVMKEAMATVGTVHSVASVIGEQVHLPSAVTRVL
ncbi:hypothetical protein [Methyloterricola oryzae]|uniref:hypothetical protein n=1 Tax=Methyloterricola oryzae TaxID=1495050 RepID=UPI0005EB98B7|nr:hypothetical protein [Methyloterricola oryzae]